MNALLFVFIAFVSSYSVGKSEDELIALMKGDWGGGESVKNLLKDTGQTKAVLKNAIDLLAAKNKITSQEIISSSTNVSLQKQHVGPLLEDIHIRLLAHVLLWSKKLDLPIPLTESDLRHLDRSQYHVSLVRLMLSLFDVIEPFFDEKVQLSNVVDLKTLTLLNGDFLLRGLQLGDYAEKQDLQHVKRFKLEGSHMDITLKAYYYLLNEALKSKTLEDLDEGKGDNIDKQLKLIRWQLKFAAMFDKPKAGHHLPIAKILIRNLPPDFELCFPLKAPGHAMMISFRRSDLDSYGIKVYNSGGGIENHFKVEMPDGGIKYSPFLGFKDLDWTRLSESFLLSLFLNSDYSVDRIYKGMLGSFVLGGNGWLYEDYVAHAKKLDGPQTDLPKLIITQRSGTCTAGAIKAFLASNLNVKLYKRLIQFIKVDQTLRLIEKNARSWIATYRFKEDARYTLRSIVRNIARRMPSMTYLKTIRACLVAIETAPRHKAAAHQKFELTAKAFGKGDEDDSSIDPPLPRNLVLPDLSTKIVSLVQLVETLKQIHEFVKSGLLETALLKLYFLRAIESLPLFTMEELGSAEPTKKRAQIIQALHLTVQGFSLAYNGDFRKLSEKSYELELFTLRIFVHHYATLSEKYYLRRFGSSRPAFTLADCGPPFKEVVFNMDYGLLHSLRDRTRLEECASLTIYGDVGGRYIEAMKEWKQVCNDEISKLPMISDDLFKCLKTEGSCQDLIDKVPSYSLEFFYVMSLERLLKAYVDLLPPYSYSLPRNYAREKFYHLATSRHWDRVDEKEATKAPISFATTMQMHSFLSDQTMTYDLSLKLLMNSYVMPLEKLDKLWEDVGDKIFVSKAHPLQISQFYPAWEANIRQAIQDILEYVKDAPLPDMFAVYQYYLVILHFKIQLSILDGREKSGIDQLIRDIEKSREMIQKAIDSGMLASTDDILGSFDWLLVACHRTVLSLHSVDTSHGVLASDLLAFAETWKRTREHPIEGVYCNGFLLHYAHLGLVDILKNAKKYSQALNASPEILKELVKLEAEELDSVEPFDLSRFPLIGFTGGRIWNLFFRRQEAMKTTEHFAFLNRTQSFLRDSEKESRVEFHDKDGSIVPKVFLNGKVFHGQKKPERDAAYIFASSSTGALLIGKESKEIWLQLSGHTVLQPKWLKSDSGWLANESKGASWKLSKASSSDSGLVKAVFSFYKSMACLVLAHTSHRILFFPSHLVWNGRMYQPLILHVASMKLSYLDMDDSSRLRSFEKFKVQDAADMEKYPIVCSLDDCVILMPSHKKHLMHQIPLQKSGQYYKLMPKSRVDHLVTIHRLSKAFLYDFAFKNLDAIDLEEKLTHTELELLQQIIISGRNNPESSSISISLLHRLWSILNAARKECDDKEPLKCEVLLKIIQSAAEVAKQYENQLPNIDSELRPKSIAPFLASAELYVKSNWIQEALNKNILGALEFLDIKCPTFELPSVTKQASDVVSYFEGGSSIKKEILLFKNISAETDIKVHGEEDRIFKAEAILLATSKSMAISADSQRLLEATFSPRSNQGKNCRDYIKEIIAQKEGPKPMLLWVNRIASGSSPNISNGSLLQPLKSVYSNYTSLYNLNPSDMKEKKGLFESKIVSSFVGCFNSDLRDLDAIGRRYDTWRLLSSLSIAEEIKKCIAGSQAMDCLKERPNLLPNEMANLKGCIDKKDMECVKELLNLPSIDRLLEMVKDCISHSDIECVRQKLHCPALKDDFMANATAYLQLDYIERRKKDIVEDANDLPQGEIGKFLTWQHATSFVLKRNQVESVLAATKLKDGTYPEIVLQRVMASGKTFTLGPLITNGKADGWHLPVLIVPTALFESQSVDIMRRQQLFFGQQGMPLRFGRISDFSDFNHLIKLLREMVNMVNSHGYIICAPEAIQAMENSFIEMLNPVKKVHQVSFDAMRMILRLLRSRGAATIDEIDTIFNPQRELNYPIGEPEKIDPVYVYMSALLEYIIHSRGVQEQRKLLKESKDNSFQLQLLQAFKDLAKEDPWKEVIGQLANFDVDFLSTAPRGAKVSDHDIKLEYYLIMWQQLHRWIPNDLEAEVNLNFGRSKKHPEYWMAKPFKAAKVPSEESEFSNPYETLNKTFSMYYAFGIDETQVGHLFWHATEESSDLEGIKKLFGLTASFDLKKAKEIAGHFNGHLKGKGPAHLQALTILLNYMRKVAVPRDLKYYRESIKSDALSMASRFKSLSGYSGTLPNDFVFPERLRNDIRKDEEAKERIKKKTKEEPRNQRVRLGPGKDVKQLEAFMKQVVGDGSVKPRALIDIGALFKDYDNIEVAKELLSCWKHVQVILFFHPETNKIVGMKRDKDGNVDDKNLLSTNGTELEKLEKAIGKVAYGIFFDQWHTTGTDIPLPDNAHGIATIGSKTTDRDLTQGVMRLRKFMSAQQSVEFVIEPTLNLDGRNVAKIIKYTEQVAAENIKKENLQVAFAKLKNEVRASILDTLIEMPRLPLFKANNIYQVAKHFLVSTEPGIAVAFGSELEEASSTSVISSYAALVSRMLCDLVKEKILDAGLESRLIEIAKASEKVPLEKRTLVPKGNVINMNNVQFDQSSEQQRVSLRMQDHLNDFIGLRKNDESARKSYLSSGLELKFDSSLKFKESDQALILENLSLPPNTRTRMTFRDLVKRRSRQDFSCIDKRIYVTLDFAFVSTRNDLEPTIGLWQPFGYLLKNLLWIQNANGSKMLVVCTCADASNFVEKVKKLDGYLPERQIALIDAKGLVYESSHPKTWQIGKEIEDEDLKKLLRDIYLLFGSYPQMKNANYDDLANNPDKAKCFGTILEQYALEGKHQVAFLNDKRLRDLFKVDVSKYLKGGRQAEVRQLEDPPIPNDPVNLCSEANLIYAALLHQKTIAADCQIEWSKMVKIMEFIHEKLLSDRRLEPAQVKRLCDSVMQESMKVVRSKEDSVQWVKDRISIVSIAKHVLNIDGLFQFLHLEEDLPLTKVKPESPSDDVGKVTRRKEGRLIVEKQSEEDLKRTAEELDRKKKAKEVRKAKEADEARQNKETEEVRIAEEAEEARTARGDEEAVHKAREAEDVAQMERKKKIIDAELEKTREELALKQKEKEAQNAIEEGKLFAEIEARERKKKEDSKQLLEELALDQEKIEDELKKRAVELALQHKKKEAHQAIEEEEVRKMLAESEERKQNKDDSKQLLEELALDRKKIEDELNKTAAELALNQKEKEARQALEAEKAKAEEDRRAREDKKARELKAEEVARRAREAEEARKAKEAEEARIAKEVEEARKAKEAEEARIAKEAEEARKAKEAEEAARNHKAKDDEEAIIRQKAEEVRKAREVEEAIRKQKAKDAEETRKAKEVEEAESKAKEAEEVARKAIREDEAARKAEDARKMREGEEATLRQKAEDDARRATEAEEAARKAKEAGEPAGSQKSEETGKQKTEEASLGQKSEEATGKAREIEEATLRKKAEEARKAKEAEDDASRQKAEDDALKPKDDSVKQKTEGDQKQNAVDDARKDLEGELKPKNNKTQDKKPQGEKPRTGSSNSSSASSSSSVGSSSSSSGGSSSGGSTSPSTPSQSSNLDASSTAEVGNDAARNGPWFIALLLLVL